jgi:hypothetical protein
VLQIYYSTQYTAELEEEEKVEGEEEKEEVEGEEEEKLEEKE